MKRRALLRLAAFAPLVAPVALSARLAPQAAAPAKGVEKVVRQAFVDVIKYPAGYATTKPVPPQVGDLVRVEDQAFGKIEGIVRATRETYEAGRRVGFVEVTIDIIDKASPVLAKASKDITSITRNLTVDSKRIVEAGRVLAPAVASGGWVERSAVLAQVEAVGRGEVACAVCGGAKADTLENEIDDVTNIVERWQVWLPTGRARVVHEACSERVE